MWILYCAYCDNIFEIYHNFMTNNKYDLKCVKFFFIENYYAFYLLHKLIFIPLFE